MVITPMDLLHHSWSRSWQALGASGDGVALMQQLITAYNEPQRKYHTVQHLSECLSVLAEQLHLAQHAGEVEMALWFHDAVYDVHAKDNEAQSAAWATRALQLAGVGVDGIARIEALIMATYHNAAPQTTDQQLLVDVDLAILGADETRFLEYETQIRAEYAWVPEELFQTTRRGILKAFADRQPIYGTPALRELFERQAHLNLEQSVAVLAGTAHSCSS
jgi:predicted metal-dependent HD superfamily phosphohydrolase